MPLALTVTPCTNALDITLPPLTFPVATTWPAVVTLPPVTLPVAEINPAVVTLPPITLPLALKVTP